ncbi:MAG: hypothetical protein AAF564_15605 [Bacteroidota bacterium]
MYQSYRSILGIETERWVYAYAHGMHDDFHIIRRRIVNNGNTDADAEIEPPRPPRLFEVNGAPTHIALRWENMSGSPDPLAWEIYRLKVVVTLRKPLNQHGWYALQASAWQTSPSCLIRSIWHLINQCVCM